MHYLQRIYKYMPNSELHITQNNAAKQYIKLTTTSTYHELYLAIDFYPLPLNTLHVPNIYISRYRRVSDSMSLKTGVLHLVDAKATGETGAHARKVYAHGGMR